MDAGIHRLRNWTRASLFLTAIGLQPVKSDEPTKPIVPQGRRGIVTAATVLFSSIHDNAVLANPVEPRRARLIAAYADVQDIELPPLPIESVRVLSPSDVNAPAMSGASDLSARTPRPIYPIDLAGALRLAGARDLDIAIARERIAQSIAEWERAQVLWLPSFFVGPNWNRFDGQIQDNQGNVFTTGRSSLFIGGTVAGGSAVYGPPPGGGAAPVSSLAAVLRISDAIFEPMSARQVVNAQRARQQAVTNDTLLALTESYLDLQRAAGRVAIAREAVNNAEALVDLTAAYVDAGKGLEADHRRSLTERDKRRQDLAEMVGQWKVASADLVRRTRLDPRIVVAPIEPPETIIQMVAPEYLIDDLIVVGLRQRPELAEAQAFVDATLIRLKQARLRPLVPSLAVRLSAGGFGGGRDEFFGNFGGRQDADVNLYWELLNFGLGDRAIMRGRAAEQRAAVLTQMKTQDLVAADVAASYEEVEASREQIGESRNALPEALRSLALNLDNIREGAGLPGATRPIEVLQPIQALATARGDYLDAVLAYNRAQFRLYRALGRPPMLAASNSVAAPPGPGPILNPGPSFRSKVQAHAPGHIRTLLCDDADLRD